MELSTNSLVGLFIDRSSPGVWIVRDPEGKFWLVPPVDSPWENRRRYYPTGAFEPEPVPLHYRRLLELPF